MSDTAQNEAHVPLTRDKIAAPILNVIQAYVREAPNLPVHIHKLLDIISDSGSDSLDVANAASADPGLVSKILRVVNSSYYGLSKKTDNIHFAIVLLGFNEVRKIALQTSLTVMFPEGNIDGGYDTRGLWEHSYLVSICAEALERAKDSKNAGELLTLGLLHDLGKFVLFRLAVAMKKKGIAPFSPLRNGENATIIQKEESLFRINHPITGSMLAEKFDLSERVCAVIEFHHHPSYHPIGAIPDDYVRDVATISISDSIVNRMTGRRGFPEPRPEYFEVIGLPASIDDCLTGDLRETLEKARDFVSYID